MSTSTARCRSVRAGSFAMASRTDGPSYAGTGLSSRTPAAPTRRPRGGGGGPLVEDPGAHVEGLRGDLEAAGELLEDLRARLLQTPLDLAEVGVRDTGELGELTQRQPGVLPLLLEERA